MTTKQELIEGLRMIAREGERVTASYGPDDWAYAVHDEEGGWSVKQLFCHLVGTAEALPGIAGALSQAEEGQNIAANLDIDDFNAQGVSAREKMSTAELIQALKDAYEKAAEAVEGLPDDQLVQQRQFGQVKGSVADLIQTFVVLHGLSHVYHAQSRPLN